MVDRVKLSILTLGPILNPGRTEAIKSAFTAHSSESNKGLAGSEMWIWCAAQLIQLKPNISIRWWMDKELNFL